MACRRGQVGHHLVLCIEDDHGQSALHDFLANHLQGPLLVLDLGPQLRGGERVEGVRGLKG